MKKFLLVTTALAAFVAGPAVAADLAVKAPPVYKAAPPPPPPVFSWTGFYVGVNIGYGVGRNPLRQDTASGPGFPGLAVGTALYGAPTNHILSPQGVNGGFQLGYNWQVAPSFVLGFETDIQWSNMKDTANCLLPCNTGVVTVPALGLFPVVFSDVSASHKLDWFGTVRGRLGYAAGPFLLFATGGFAYGDVERSASVAGRTSLFGGAGTINTFAGSFSAKSTRTGWTVGGGAEGQLGGGWSAKAEYLYIDLGTITDSFNTIYVTGGGGAVAGTVAATRTDTTDIREHVFRFGLNYKFGGPVVAAY